MNIQMQNMQNQSPIGVANVNCGEQAKKEAAKEKDKTLCIQFTPNQAQETSLAEKKKDLARKKALKVVKDAFESEQSNVDARKELREENEVLREENYDIISKIKEQKASALEHAETDEEKEQIEKIYAKTIEVNKDINNNLGQIRENIAASREIKKDMLKSQEMFDAKQEEEAIMKDAGKTFISDLVQDGIDYMEEKREEEKEKAEERAEKKEEKEERKEAAKEQELSVENRREEQQPKIEHNDVSYSDLLDSKQSYVNDKLQDIMEENQLIVEDLKGIVVDAVQ